MLGSDVRHAFVEGASRIGHGQIADTPDGEIDEYARHQTATIDVCVLSYLRSIALNVWELILFLCRLASASDLLTKQYKERPPVLGNLSLGGSAQDLYRWYVWECQICRSTFHFPQQQQISKNYLLFSLKLQVTQNRSCRNRNRSLKNKNTNNKI